MQLEMSERKRSAVTAGVMLGMFLAAFEMTGVGTALPTIIASLGGLNHYSWVFSAYLITSTVTVPIWGKLSDLYGRRPTYQISIAIFLVGSVLSGLSTSMPQLIAFRALQGLGAGGILPLGQTIIGNIYTLEQRARKQALFSGVWGLASIVGPIAGGFITDMLSWRWIFYINIPFGFAAALIMGVALQEPKRERRPVIDYAGAAVLIAAISMFMLALGEGGGTLATMTNSRNLALFGGAAAFSLLLVYVERRAHDPLIPFDLFRNRVVTAVSVAGFTAGAAMFGAILFVPLFAQAALGTTATGAGTILIPLMVAWVATSTIGGRLLLRIGYRTTSTIGCVVLTTAFVLLSTVDRQQELGWLYLYLTLIGAGLGLTMLTLLMAIQQAVERTQLGIATSINQFTRLIGGAVGVAFMGVVLSSGLATNLHEIARRGTSILSTEQASALASNPNALIEPHERAALHPETLEALRGSLTGALQSVFRVAAAFAVFALIAVSFLPQRISRPAISPPEPKCTTGPCESPAFDDLHSITSEQDAERPMA
jgi:EmrB/QacA subfamily drug resistance transporter